MLPKLHQDLVFLCKGGFRGGARGAEAPPLQVHSTPVQMASHVLLETATVEEGRMEARVVTKRLGDGQ